MHESAQSSPPPSLAKSPGLSFGLLCCCEAGSQQVALRQRGVVYHLHTDYLGSSNVSYRADVQQTITQRYYPWGAIRSGPDNALPTDYTFTLRLSSGQASTLPAWDLQQWPEMHPAAARTLTTR